MPFYKVTYKFEHPAAAWTENYFQFSDNIEGFISLAPNEVNAMLAPRGNGVKLVSKYVIEEGGTRESYEKTIGTTKSDAAGGTFGAKDVAGVCVVMNGNLSGGGRRLTRHSGVPDGDVIPVASGASKANARLKQNLAEMASIVTLSGQQMAGRVKQPPTEEGFEWRRVVSFAEDPTNDRWTRVTVSTMATPLTVGEDIYFKGVDPLELPWIQGDYLVVGESTTDHFSIATKYREPSASYPVRDVQFRRIGYTYPPYTEMLYKEISTRKRRGPFGRRRGARSARKIRR